MISKGVPIDAASKDCITLKYISFSNMKSLQNKIVTINEIVKMVVKYSFLAKLIRQKNRNTIKKLVFVNKFL